MERGTCTCRSDRFGARLQFLRFLTAIASVQAERPASSRLAVVGPPGACPGPGGPSPSGYGASHRAPIPLELPPALLRDGLDDAAHPGHRAAVRRREAHPALEQAGEEVVEDVFGLLLEVSESDPGFFEERRTDGDRDGAYGAVVSFGGPLHQRVEFVRAIVGLRVCGMVSNIGILRAADVFMMNLSLLVLGFGFWVLGFWGFGVLGFWVLGFWGFGVLGVLVLGFGFLV